MKRKKISKPYKINYNIQHMDDFVCDLVKYLVFTFKVRVDKPYTDRIKLIEETINKAINKYLSISKIDPLKLEFNLKYVELQNLLNGIKAENYGALDFVDYVYWNLNQGNRTEVLRDGNLLILPKRG